MTDSPASDDRFARPRTLLVVAGAVVAGGLAWLLRGPLLQPGMFAVDVAVFAAIMLYLSTERLTLDHPHTRLGPAVLVTAFRLILALLLFRASRGIEAAAVWTVVIVASVAALLDVVDGPIARRTGLASAFGARLDMGTDALLTLVLSVLVWRLGKAGPWVIASGAMFPVFMFAGFRWPWLAADLPPRVRRQAVCVVQIVALIVALAPVVTPPLSTAISAVALAILTWSFYVDVAWLARHREL